MQNLAAWKAGRSVDHNHGKFSFLVLDKVLEQLVEHGSVSHDNYLLLFRLADQTHGVLCDLILGVLNFDLAVCVYEFANLVLNL